MGYLEKQALYPPLIDQAPRPGLGLVVAIPCHDEPDLLGTLQSLTACTLPRCSVEVIVVVNSAENAPQDVKSRNAATVKVATAWARANNRSDLQFHILHFPDLPAKHAGVGLARKIAMDEATRRLEQIQRPEGVIVCLDADSRVQDNYLEAIEQYFTRHPNCPAAGIHYEHPLEGSDHPAEVYTAITSYELHLRYYVHALRWAGLPTATQTVGSSMAVRADAYQAQGGMNRRQAGEDFYFLHKFTPLKGFGEIKTTKVIPSPRTSHRVPFGTGKAVGDILAGNMFLTYAPQTFADLRQFLGEPAKWYSSTVNTTDNFEQLPTSIASFLRQESFGEKLVEIQQNTASYPAFEKRFFRWFDAFKAMKYVHFARDHHYPAVSVAEAARTLLTEPEYDLQKAMINDWGERELLLYFRALDAS